MKTRSSVATLVPRPRDVRNRTKIVPFGLCIHQTGRGIVDVAQATMQSPIAVALGRYTQPGNNFAHYAIDYDGKIYQIADDRERAWQAGIDASERALYQSGAWRQRVSKVGLKIWQKRWESHENPLQIFPTRSPNDCYLGVELLPLMDRTFTPAQYGALTRLCLDIEDRYSIGLLGTGRLVLHEDLEPLTRWDRGGGWDPGYLRRKPRFHLTKLLEDIAFEVG